MKLFENKKLKVWFDEALLNASPENCFDPEYWQKQGKIVGNAKGRGTTWFIQLDSIQGALRHYRRGGLFGRLVSDHYFFSGWEQTRSYQEFQILNHLKQAGVNVPRPVAARAIKKHVCYQADLLTERVPDARDLVSVLQEKPLSDAMYQKIGKEIRKMHDAQVNHTDLNIHNILIDDQEKVWIIDFDKCVLGKQNNSSWQNKNLERLHRSFNKEKKNRNIYFNKLAWNELVLGYRYK